MRPTLAIPFAECIRGWHQRGYTPATSSNFSCRSAGQGFWVSRSGVDKTYFSPSDFIPVTSSGQALGPDRPSAEAALHADIYSALPAMQCVAHIHSPAVTALSMQLPPGLDEEGGWALTGYELQKAFEGIATHEHKLQVPIVPNSQTMVDITQAIEPWLQQWQLGVHPPGYIIRGHGLYTWATTLEALERHVEAFEYLATIQLKLANTNSGFK
jgi:methylthioribulose-1-phosphate dehydratase